MKLESSNMKRHKVADKINKKTGVYRTKLNEQIVLKAIIVFVSYD
jgi:hypothetical protein